MTIDLEQARELLKKAVETQGEDFVYNPDGLSPCAYEPQPNSDGPQRKTGCLVGVALSLAGETRHLGYRGTVEGLAEAFPDMLAEDAVPYLLEAQVFQDCGSAWGEAFGYAEKSLAESDED